MTLVFPYAMQKNFINHKLANVNVWDEWRDFGTASIVGGLLLSLMNICKTKNEVLKTKKHIGIIIVSLAGMLTWH